MIIPRSRPPRPATPAARRVLIAVLAALCLLVPVGCAPQESGSAGPVALRISTWGNDSRLKLTQQAIDAFTESHPDITVSLETASGVPTGTSSPPPRPPTARPT